ncbi:MAG: PD-(D/E)XK nuclease family protein [Bacillota bacterium]
MRINKNLVAYFLDKLGKGPETYAVFPTDREKSRLLQDLLAELAGGAITQMHFYTFSAFTRDLMEWFLEDPPVEVSFSQSRLLFSAVFREMVRSGQLPLLAKIADLPGTIPEVEEEVKRLRQRDFFTNRLDAIGNGLQREVFLVGRAYLDKLKVERWCDPERIYEILVDILTDPKPRFRISSRYPIIILVGGFHLLPYQEKLLTLLSLATEVELIAPETVSERVVHSLPKVAVRAVCQNRKRESFNALIRYWDKSKSASQGRETGTEGVQILLCPGLFSEAWEIGRRIKELILLKGYHLGDLALVLRDMETYFPIFQEIFLRQGIPLAGSRNLLTHKLSRALISMIRASINGPDQLSMETVLRDYWLPPYSTLHDEMAALLYEAELDFSGDWQDKLQSYDAQLDHLLKKSEDEAERRMLKRKREIVAASLENWPQLLAAINDLADTDDIAVFLEKFLGYLRGWKPAHTETSCLYAYFAWLEAVQTIYAGIVKGYNIKKDDFLSIITAALKKPLPYGEAEGVEVFQPHEITGHMDIPVVFIAGMTEGQYPRNIDINWLQEESGAFRSDPQAEIAQERHLFSQLLKAATDRIFFTAPLTDQNDRPLTISPFLTEIGEYLDPAVICRVSAPYAGSKGLETTRDEWIIKNPQAALDGKEASMFLNAALQSGIARSAQERCGWNGFTVENGCRKILKDRYPPDFVFSVTMLSDYAYCPFYYFSKYLLKLPDSSTASADAMITGNMAHRILEIFMRRHLRTGLVPAREKEYQDEVGAVLEQCIKENDPHWKNKSLLRYFLCRWIHFELRLRFEMENDFTPAALEYDFGQERSFFLMHGDESIYLKGRIDRIDQSKQHGCMVFDYKMSPSQAKFTADSPDDLQIPLYLIAVLRLMGEVAFGGGYYAVKEPKIHGLWIGKDFKPAALKGAMLSESEWESLQEKIIARILQYRRQILAGEFSPSAARCRENCPYRIICRRKDRTDQEDEIL